MTGTHQRTPDPAKSGVHLRTAGAALLGLLAGLAGGFFLARERPVTSGSSASRPAIPSSKEVRTGGDNTVVTTKRDRGTGRVAGSHAPRLDVDPAVLAELLRTEQPALEARTILFSDGDQIAAALAISPDEKRVLEREWARIKEAIVRLQRKALRYEQTQDSLWVGADPFDGESLQSTFREAARATLGPERGDAFLEMVRADEAFGAWGRRTSAAYSIQYDRQPGGPLVYRITERQKPGGPAGRSWISNRIPEHIREVTDALGVLPEAPKSSQR
jgi:hypothetical protein